MMRLILLGLLFIFATQVTAAAKSAATKPEAAKSMDEVPPVEVPLDAESDELDPGKGYDFSLAPDARYSNTLTDSSKLKTQTSGLIETESIEDDNTLSTTPRVEIIVDSSGSMGQMLSLDKSKMYFMKKMLTRYMTDQYRLKAQTGLRVYGSKRVGDCQDNQLMVPFNESSLGSIEQKIAGLSPVGKTPLYHAVRDAAWDLHKYSGPRVVVVFTDGEDTCGGNPCKEGNGARLDPLNNTQIFVVAIGFKPNSDDLKKVACLGSTTTANSESDLFEALGGISQKVFSKQLNLLVTSPDPTAAVQLYTEDKGVWKPFRIFTAAFGTTVPPGKYQAVVLLDPPFKFESFTIPPKKVVHLTVHGEGQVRVDFLQKILDVEILDKNMKLVKRFKSDEVQTVPEGRWTLKISKQPFYEKFQAKFDVYPNGFYKYKVTGLGALKIQAPQIVGFYVYDHRKNLLGNYLTGFPFALPIGQYSIRVSDKCKFETVDVKDDGKLQLLKCP